MVMDAGPPAMGAYVVETVRVVMAAGPLVMGMGVVSAAVAEAFF